MPNIKFNPTIQMLPYPINSGIDELEDDDNACPLYNVIVSQGELKIMFLVIHRPPKGSEREYEVIKGTHLVITGISAKNNLVETKDVDIISSDISLTNKELAYALAPLGVKLLKVNVHSRNFIESNGEGKGFIMQDLVKYEELKRRINNVCKKMMSIPKVNQF